MAKESIDSGNQGAVAMTGISALRSELEESEPFDYFSDDGFDEEDKLALLHFLMQEFGLKQPVVLMEAGARVAARFLIEQYSRQHTKIDLLYLDADALCEGAAFLTAKLYGLLSRKGVIFIKSSGSVLEPSVIPAESFEAILVTPMLSVYARKGGERPIRSMRYQVDLFRRKLAIERRLKDAR